MFSKKLLFIIISFRVKLSLVQNPNTTCDFYLKKILLLVVSIKTIKKLFINL